MCLICGGCAYGYIGMCVWVCVRPLMCVHIPRCYRKVKASTHPEGRALTGGIGSEWQCVELNLQEVQNKGVWATTPRNSRAWVCALWTQFICRRNDNACYWPSQQFVHSERHSVRAGCIDLDAGSTSACHPHTGLRDDHTHTCQPSLQEVDQLSNSRNIPSWVLIWASG